MGGVSRILLYTVYRSNTIKISICTLFDFVFTNPITLLIPIISLAVGASIAWTSRLLINALIVGWFICSSKTGLKLEPS